MLLRYNTTMTKLHGEYRMTKAIILTILIAILLLMSSPLQATTGGGNGYNYAYSVDAELLRTDW